MILYSFTLTLSNSIMTNKLLSILFNPVYMVLIMVSGFTVNQIAHVAITGDMFYTGDGVSERAL